MFPNERLEIVYDSVHQQSSDARLAKESTLRGKATEVETHDGYLVGWQRTSKETLWVLCRIVPRHKNRVIVQQPRTRIFARHRKIFDDQRTDP